MIGHSADAGALHMSAGSVWMVVSMVAVSLFLLAFAWALLRPKRITTPTPSDIATERYARGEIDAEDFERIVGDIDNHRR